MSLNTELFMITKNQLDNDFFGRKDVKTTFFHKRIPVRITVVINEAGDFVKAVDTPQAIYTPSSYDSLCRNNGDHSSYALYDQYRYIASSPVINGDGEESETVYHRKYIEALSEWYEYTLNPRLRAVLEYCKKGTIGTDINAVKVKPMDNIAFAIQDATGNTALVEDDELFESFIQMQIKKMSEYDPQGWCYVTGQHIEQAKIFPRGLHGFSWKSHYLSRQDTGKTVYFGIFEKATDAAAISKLASYYIFWALNFILEFHSMWIKDTAYALVSIDGKWMPELNVGIRDLLGTEGEISNEDLFRKEAEVLDMVSTSSGIVYLSVGALSDAKITIRKYQTFCGIDKKLVIQNYFGFMKTMCSFQRILIEGKEYEKVFRRYEGLIMLTKRLLSVEKVSYVSVQFRKVIDRLLDSMILGIPISGDLIGLAENGVVVCNDTKKQQQYFRILASFQKFNYPDIKSIACFNGRFVYLLSRIARVKEYEKAISLIVSDTLPEIKIDDEDMPDLGRYEKEYQFLKLRAFQEDKIRNILGYSYEMEKTWRKYE